MCIMFYMVLYNKLEQSVLISPSGAKSLNESSPFLSTCCQGLDLVPCFSSSLSLRQHRPAPGVSRSSSFPGSLKVPVQRSFFHSTWEFFGKYGQSISICASSFLFPYASVFFLFRKSSFVNFSGHIRLISRLRQRLAKLSEPL